MFKLDKIDKQLLIALDTNATLPISKLAKNLKVSREVISYRIKQLELKKIILNYITLANFTKTGHTHYKLYIKYTNIPKEKKETLLNELAKHPKLGWLASTEGIFDLMFSIRFKDKYDFEEFKDKLFMKYNKYFSDVKFAMATEGETKPRYYILDKMPKKIHTFFHVNKSKEEKMDENDIQILNTISLNAREPYANLARITNLTPRIIRYRRNDLTKRKIITGSKLVINYRKLGYLFFKCFITFKNSNEKRYNTFKSYIRNHPNMIYWIKTIGSWDLELEIEIPSIEKFYEVVDELKETFPDIIGSFDASLVSKEHAIMHV